MLKGAKGILVNEIASRIGGAYEDITIPFITGIDILGLNIDLAAGIKPKLQETNENKPLLSTQLFFLREGTVDHVDDISKVKELPFVINAGFNYGASHVSGSIKNASARVGYVIVEGNSEENLAKNLKKTFDNIGFYDKEGNNLVIRGVRGYR